MFVRSRVFVSWVCRTRGERSLGRLPRRLQFVFRWVDQTPFITPYWAAIFSAADWSMGYKWDSITCPLHFSLSRGWLVSAASWLWNAKSALGATHFLEVFTADIASVAVFDASTAPTPVQHQLLLVFAAR